MSLFVCNVCNHVEFDAAPDRCPVCGSQKFAQNDNLFKEAEEKSPEAPPKHIPRVKVSKECALIPEDTCTDLFVRVGEKLHPMTDAHFIQWVDCYVDKAYVSRSEFTPGVQPATCFHLKKAGEKVTLIEHCNKHGHWSAEASLA